MADPSHLQTIHTWESVRQGSGLDWRNQPEVFKRYPPGFPAVDLDRLPEIREFLHSCAGITARRTYPGGAYFLRVQPSAGALYPCELYLQARDLEGLADGIYHYEPLEQRLRLLHRLAAGEGIEAWTATPAPVRGALLLVSAISYRSSWKYGNRSFRYCLLDSGHLAGAVEAAAALHDRPFAIRTRLERDRIDAHFGFSPGELTMALLCCGEPGKGTVRPPAMNLPEVDGCGGVAARNRFIEDHYRRTGILSGCSPRTRRQPYFLRGTDLAQAIGTRRSIRAFTGRTMRRSEYEALLRAALLPVTTDCDEPVRLLAVVNRVDSLEPGIYDRLTCLRAGDLAGMAGYLCLEQRLAADSGVTFFFLSQGRQYLPLMLKAGLMGQRIYLAATALGLGCSGLGAFYDRETADFLDTEAMVLYAMAVGR